MVTSAITNVLDIVFHPRSIALAGIPVTNPEHWTRNYLDALLEFKFDGSIYLVNPRGGEIKGMKVYPRLTDIPGNVDYVISTVPAQSGPALLEECAGKGVKVVQFCTAGLGETGEDEGIQLQAELCRLSRQKGIRLIGPNCMGVYCPESHMSFFDKFPKDGGPIGYICQSGGNVSDLISRSMLRGVRFSKVVSFGNACDLNESDFLEYLATDPATSIIALYIEGVKDGKRFRQTLAKAAQEKTVVLLKGGLTEGGARAAAGHTGALAGSEATWDALCRQLGIIQVRTLGELADVLVSLQFRFFPAGRRAALIGRGGGASVLVTDAFEQNGLKVPPLPVEVRQEIREFTPVAGNILKNPIDYSQAMVDVEKLARTVGILLNWDGVDFLVGFLNVTWGPQRVRGQVSDMVEAMLTASRESGKPMALVIEPSILQGEVDDFIAIVERCVSLGLPVYYSFGTAAKAINLVLGRGKRINN